MPPLVTIKFVRKPFAVEAIQVTAENMRQVARWSRGKIQSGDSSIFGPTNAAPTGVKVKFIKVPVKRPLNERQTMAQAGDWIVTQGAGHKVYTDKAFKGSFDPFIEDVIEESELASLEEEAEEKVSVQSRAETTPITPSDVFQASHPLTA